MRDSRDVRDSRNGGSSEGPLRVLCFGGGVQSTALLLMACEGRLRLDHAIYADTGDDPESVHRVVARARELCGSSGIGFDEVSAGHLMGDMGRSGVNKIPAWVATKDGKGSMPLRRVCTEDYKIIPIRRKVRELLGMPFRGRPRKGLLATKILGISTDEMGRMRRSMHAWYRLEYPLIEMGMSRQDCLAYLEGAGWGDVARSTCVFCPFHTMEDWRRVWPAHRERIVEMERLVQSSPGIKGRAYLTRHLRPIEEVMESGEEGPRVHHEEECFGYCGG